MTIDELRYFVELCSQGSFSKAAKTLHISQQGLSLSVKKLEQELSQTLFDRSNRGASPTQFGALFLEKVTPVINEYDKLSQFVIEMKKNNSGSINFGAGKCSYLFRPLADCIADFIISNPTISMRISETDSYDICDAIDSGKLDLGFDILPVDPEKFETISIAKVGLSLVVSKKNKLSDYKEVMFSDLSEEYFGLPYGMSKMSNLITERCEKCKFTPNIYYNSDHPGLLTQMVNKNYGITFTSQRDSELIKRTYDNISVMRLNPPLELEIAFILSKKRKRSKAVNSLISYVLNDSAVNSAQSFN